MVLSYAASPVPFLVVGAIACLRVQARTYRAWFSAFAILVLVWMMAGVVALVGVGGEEAFVVFFHLVAAALGAGPVTVIRAVARQRGPAVRGPGQGAQSSSTYAASHRSISA